MSWQLWAALGLLIAAGEMLTGGFFLLAIGGGALAVALFAALAPTFGWQAQGAVWSAAALAFLLALRQLRPRRGAEPEAADALGQRAARLIGRVVALDQPVGPAGGRVRLDDTVWPARADPALPAGSHARIAAVDGATLVLAPA